MKTEIIIRRQNVKENKKEKDIKNETKEKEIQEEKGCQISRRNTEGKGKEKENKNYKRIKQR